MYERVLSEQAGSRLRSHANSIEGSTAQAHPNYFSPLLSNKQTSIDLPISSPASANHLSFNVNVSINENYLSPAVSASKQGLVIKV